ncbi:hypothetical protein KI387_030312, partial [Taxus chinensis]
GDKMECMGVNHSLGMHDVINRTDERTHIGSESEPKEAIIGDYWLEKEVSKIIDLL